MNHEFKGMVLCRALDARAIENLTERVEFRDFPDGTMITKAGTSAQQVFLLLSGHCVGVIQTESGKDIVVDRIEQGRVFGELGVLDGGTRVRSVRAAGPVRAGVVDAIRFDQWLRATPQAMRNLLAELSSDARERTDRYFEMAVHDVETRVRLFLIRLLIESGGLRNGGVLSPAPSHSTIAAHVGANREAVSRAISRFVAQGYIESGRKRILVLDARAFESGTRPPV